MADVTEAPTQDAIAESLLGPEEQQTAVEQPETEQTQDVEAEGQPLEQEQQESQEEVENWLPSEQDKIFPDEILQRYATRYGLDEAWQANPQLKQLVIDKINSDIYLQQLQQQEQFEPEPEAQPEPTQQQPQLSREQHFQNLTRVVAERTDPEVAKAFHGEFMGVWNLPLEQQPQALAQVTSKYMLNMVNTFLPDMLQAQLSGVLNTAFPGFGDMYDRSSHAMAWDRVRNSEPAFASLPAYGTKEFSSKLREAASRIPGFDDMQFTDGQGRPLPAQQNAERKYAMLAKIASGQNVNPQLLQQAAAAGARNARRADVRRSAGNLGSGQSKAAGGGQQKAGRFQTNSDLFDEDTMELYDSDHGRL